MSFLNAIIPYAPKSGENQDRKVQIIITMTKSSIYKIELKPETHTAEIGEYGVFEVRPYGINEDLEMDRLNREANEMLAQAKELADAAEKTKAKADEDAFLEFYKQADEQVKKTKKKIVAIIRSTFKSEKKGAVDRLFDEISLNKLKEIHDEVVANG